MSEALHNKHLPVQVSCPLGGDARVAGIGSKQESLMWRKDRVPGCCEGEG